MSSTHELQQKQLKSFCAITIALFFVIAFCFASPIELVSGMIHIVASRDALITDYFKLVGYGVAFFNSALMMSLVMFIILYVKLPFTGITLAVFFINAGFALFGKNPVSVMPILVGTYLYAKSQKVSFKRYAYTGLFGGCLAPLVTEIAHVLPFEISVNLLIAAAVGMLIGFILPSLSMHTASMHMGYNLFNIGFAAGIIGFAIVCILKGFGLESESVLIWHEGQPLWLVLVLYGYFALTFIWGLLINKGNIKAMFRIFKHPGRAVADFTLMDGIGSTFMNMAIMGICCTTYILLIGGDLSGPTVGAILTIFGFGSFGVHLKNYLPCLIGVYLSTTLKIYTVDMPAVQLAAIFCAGIAPIAGQFGIVAGIIAGMLHISLVMSTGAWYSGLNLYNNGFAAGFVAIIMIPLLESFMTRFQGKSINKRQVSRR